MAGSPGMRCASPHLQQPCAVYAGHFLVVSSARISRRGAGDKPLCYSLSHLGNGRNTWIHLSRDDMISSSSHFASDRIRCTGLYAGSARLDRGRSYRHLVHLAVWLDHGNGKGLGTEWSLEGIWVWNWVGRYGMGLGFGMVLPGYTPLMIPPSGSYWSFSPPLDTILSCRTRAEIDLSCLGPGWSCWSCLVLLGLERRGFLTLARVQESQVL